MANIPYWSEDINQVIKSLNSSVDGLTGENAQDICNRVGLNQIQSKKRTTPLGLLANQFKSPIVLILIVATIVSAFLKDWTDAIIVLAIMIGSALLSFFQEFSANNAAEKLKEQVSFKSDVFRDGKLQSIPTEQIVPGDVISLSAGSLIPAYGLVIEASDFFVNQAVLTGETFPVEKMPGVQPESAGLSERTNVVFMGTNVRSGTAKVLIVETGLQNEFERGIRKLGYLQK
jgi:Mg2+-importing ATPase